MLIAECCAWSPWLLLVVGIVWMKIAAAAEHAGGLSSKTLYQAIASGELKAARIGAGRNLITSDEWIDKWLASRAGERPEQRRAS